MRRQGLSYTVERVCRAHGISRQSYYKSLKRQDDRQDLEAEILRQVRQIRRRQPRLGARKLIYLIKPQYGRDRFFRLLRAEGLLVYPRRRYRLTTDSSHGLRYYPNLIKETVPSGPNQVWVSDITYLSLMDRDQYLALVTDLYSRKIVGWDLSGSLSVDGSLRAFKQGFSKLKRTDQLIHHSDRGIQYCSKRYVNILKRGKVRISMSAKANPYENAVAERINGILKEEYGLNQVFKDLKTLKEVVKEAIEIYNNERPHSSLGMLTPTQKYAA
jgi:transposase InsO family protein